MARKSAEFQCTDPDMLEEFIEEVDLGIYGGTNRKGEEVEPERGIAKVQLLRLRVELQGQLEAARNARDAEAGENLSGDELLDKLREEFADAPDTHLWAAVEAYCERHRLALPVRVGVVG